MLPLASYFLLLLQTLTALPVVIIEIILLASVRVTMLAQNLEGVTTQLHLRWN